MWAAPQMVRLSIFHIAPSTIPTIESAQWIRDFVKTSIPADRATSNL